jgi:ectoine hydroxylase-related dioxygenase (phytanoyl-CoA dioxygenase family)
MTVSPSIPQRSADEAPEELSRVLDEAGCLVVSGVLDEDGREALNRELEPHMEAAPVKADDEPTDFYPGKTRRVTALVARSRAVRELVMHPTPSALCEHHLAPNCEGYQLHVTAALSVGPGARSQVLHREEDTFPFFTAPRPNLILASMWAITDFTAENGGTLLVPGSHRWPAERKPEPGEIAPAEMSAGSILFWLGGTLHGAGANVSDDWRCGVILTYSLGWLRQEENQYLDMTPEIAASLAPELRERIGLSMHGGLGFYDPRVQQSSAAPKGARA